MCRIKLFLSRPYNPEILASSLHRIWPSLDPAKKNHIINQFRKLKCNSEPYMMSSLAVLVKAVAYDLPADFIEAEIKDSRSIGDSEDCEAAIVKCGFYTSPGWRADKGESIDESFLDVYYAGPDRAKVLETEISRAFELERGTADSLATLIPGILSCGEKQRLWLLGIVLRSLLNRERKLYLDCLSSLLPVIRSLCHPRDIEIIIETLAFVERWWP